MIKVEKGKTKQSRLLKELEEFREKTKKTFTNEFKTYLPN